MFALGPRSARILLLHSDPESVRSYKELLTAGLGVTVVASSDERSARSALAREDYDLFICDKALSWIGGSGPLRWIISDAIPRILLLHDPIEGREFRGIEFFPDTRPRKELVERVRRLLGPED